jgi:anhydro-N-acetylmuramic acid kinase
MTILEKTAALPKKPYRLCVGVLSGTSADATDAALVKISGCGTNTKLELLDFLAVPFEKRERDFVMQNFSTQASNVQTLSQANFLVGQIFADAVKKLLHRNQLPAVKVDFIASHGQTFWHEPHGTKIGKRLVRSTLQLGEASVIANELGIVVVSDFRKSDMAAGGEAAPLVPFFDYILFRSRTKTRGLLNIGGISNLTVLPKNGLRSDVIAFDTGAGNVLMDKLAKRFWNVPFDKHGRFAKQGVAKQTLLEKWLSHPYFKQKPPKSTGRELFTNAFLDSLLADANDLSHEDVMATVSMFTVESIFRQYKKFIEPKLAVPMTELIVSGGGAMNGFLFENLKKKFNFATVRKFDEASPISAKAKEAVMFAVLGNELICGQSAAMPSVTGVRKPVLLGKISLPPLRV